MNRLTLLRTAPAALWLALLTIALVGAGFWAINNRIDDATDAANEVARDDAESFADAAGGFAGYQLTIPIADGTGLLASPLFADPTPQWCRNALAPFGKGQVTAVIFYRGEVLCSYDTATGEDLTGPAMDWATSWWDAKSAENRFEVSGASNVGVGTFAAGPDGYLATAIPYEELGAVALVPVQEELERHLAAYGGRAVAVAMLDRSGHLIGATSQDGPIATDGEYMGDIDGSVIPGPGGVEARWAKGSFGQRFGALAVGVNPAPTDEHLAVFQSRSRAVAAGVGVFGLASIGVVALWGIRSLRRVASLVEAAADGSATSFDPPRHAPVEVVTLSDKLSRLAQRRRRHDIDRERARQNESSELGLELHDDIIQRIAAASMLSSSQPDIAAESLVETAQRIRNLSSGLCPPLLDSDGLAAAVAALDSSLITVVVTDTTDGARFDGRAERVLYRNVVEAAHNAVAHGKASTLTVDIDETDGLVVVSVEDNGTGIDPDMVNGRPGHFGITSMKSLMGYVGGTAQIMSTPTGTRVELRCPVLDPVQTTATV